MFDYDKWQEIYFTLNKHKLRTALTAFGVMWGIFMLVLLLGVGNGLRNDALANFGGNTDTVFVWTGARTQIPYQGFSKGRWTSFKTEDVEALKERIPELDLVLDINEAGGWQSAQYITRNNKSDSFVTQGTHPEVARMQLYKPIMGRFINRLDGQEQRKVAVIGQRVYETLFEEGEEPIGESINIGNVYFQVVGVFKSMAPGENAIRDEERILIPNSTLRSAFNQMHYIGHLRLTPQPGVPSSYVEERAKEVLRERHRVHPDDHAVFGSFNTQERFQQVEGLFTGITAFSWFVAAGTILAGVIGVGNIMLIVVKERTREIGLRKALGATSSSIISMVVLEAIVITAVAGYLGLVLGVLVLEGIKSLAGDADNLRFLTMSEIDINTALTAVCLLVIAGFFASLLPASNAAGVNPITALQDE